MRTENEIVAEIKTIIPDPKFLDQEIADLEAELLAFLTQKGVAYDFTSDPTLRT